LSKEKKLINNKANRKNASKLRRNDLQILKGIGLVALLLIVLNIIPTGSQPSGTINVNVSQLAQEEEAKERARLQAQNLSRKDELERHYGDDLYFGDFSKEIDEINEKFSKNFEDVFSKYVTEYDCSNKALAEIEVMNDSLMKYRNGEITFEDIYTNQAEHVRDVKNHYFVFGYTEDWNVLDFESAYKEMKLDFTSVRAEEPFIVFLLYKDTDESRVRLLNEKTYSDMAYELDELDIYEEVAITNDYSISRKVLKEASKNILEEKYGEEFVVLGDPDNLCIPRINKKEFICYPKNNPNIEFMSYSSLYSYEDKYLSTLFQAYIGMEVNRIIDKYGASDRIVQFTYLDGKETTVDKNSNDSRLVDITQITDPLQFVKENALGHFDVNIYYLKKPNEEVDVEIVNAIEKEVEDLIPYDKDTLALICFPHFYEVDEDYIPEIVEQFKRDIYSENYFRKPKTTIAEAISNLYTTRSDSESFLMIETLGRDLGDDYRSRISR